MSPFLHPDSIPGTQQLYKELYAKTNQPIPFSYHGSNATLNTAKRVTPPYLVNALEGGQLIGRSTQPDKFNERNSHNLPVLPNTWSHEEMQNALIKNARAGRASHIFFHSHETQKAPWLPVYENLMRAIQEGQIQTLPFPKPPRWDGNPKPQ